MIRQRGEGIQAGWSWFALKGYAIGRGIQRQDAGTGLAYSAQSRPIIQPIADLYS